MLVPLITFAKLHFENAHKSAPRHTEKFCVTGWSNPIFQLNRQKCFIGFYIEENTWTHRLPGNPIAYDAKFLHVHLCNSSIKQANARIISTHVLYECMSIMHEHFSLNRIDTLLSLWIFEYLSTWIIHCCRHNDLQFTFYINCIIRLREPDLIMYILRNMSFYHA